MNVFVIGSINMDLVIKTNNMPENGETISGHGFFKNAGGKGANQAVAVRKAGTKVEMVGCVGNEFDDILIAGLKKQNVGMNFLFKVDNVSSGVAVIIVNKNDNRIIVDPGANGCVSYEQVDLALSHASVGDYVLMQLEIPNEIVLYTLKKSKEKGLVTFINPAPASDINNDYFKYIDYFVVNQSESIYYTGIYPNTVTDAKNVAERIILKGVKKVVVTLGEKGSYYYDTEKEFFAEAFKTKVVDTTAAGDTYIGYLVACLSENKNISEAMEIASAAAALCITSEGAQKSIPLIEEVVQYVKEYKNKQ